MPPVVRVPDVAPAPSKPAPRASVADLVDPVPDGPDVPDLSGFERLVDSSYIPPAATQAGDTAEIPRINEEYVPRARTPWEGGKGRRRDRQQKKLAKKFSKMQEKEEARKAKELLRAEKERLRARGGCGEGAFARRRGRGPEQRRIAEEEAREARRAAEAAEREERERLEKSGWLLRQLRPWQPRLPRWKKRLNSTPSEDAPVAENEASKAGDASGVAFGAIPGAVAGFAAAETQPPRTTISTRCCPAGTR